MENNPEDEILEEAKEHLVSASHLLKKLGPNFGTISWMVEDLLVYVDNVAGGESANQIPVLADDEAELEVEGKQVNLKGFIVR